MSVPSSGSDLLLLIRFPTLFSPLQLCFLYLRQVLETDKVDLEGIRQTIQSELKAHGIPTAVYYKVALHKQKMFGHLAQHSQNIQTAENCSSKVTTTM